MERIPLFMTTSFGIDKDTIDMIGGEDGRTFRFEVSSKSCNTAILQRLCTSVSSKTKMVTWVDSTIAVY